MAKVNFTAKRVQEHTCPEGKAQAFLWDAISPGLGLRMTANGAKSYIFQGKVHGKTVRLTIGDPRSWTIDKAQEEARNLQTLIDAGKDPRAVKAELRSAHDAQQAAERRRSVMVAQAWGEYLDARRPRWTEGHHKDHLNMAQPGGEAKRRGNGKTSPGPLAQLMALRLADLTAERVSAWLDDSAQERPASAALSFRLLRAFIRWTNDRPEYSGIVPAGAYSAQSVRDVQPKVKPKDDVLQREQLPAWFAAVRSLSNRIVSAYLQGLLLTGARREELAGLRWDDVDFQWGSLTIRDKVEGERTIPLTPYLSSLLASLPRRNEWVFSSPTAENGRLAEGRYAHTRALVAAGLPHVSLHGLRRSFGTLCEWVEMPAGISAQIMGHKPSALAEKHYRRRPLDLLRMWHTKIEAWMLEQAGIRFDIEQAKHGLRAVRK